MIKTLKPRYLMIAGGFGNLVTVPRQHVAIATGPSWLGVAMRRAQSGREGAETEGVSAIEEMIVSYDRRVSP